MLKDRHIDQNVDTQDEVIDQLKQNALADIVPKIYWERNTLVTHNPDIPASQIIPKCKTGDFLEAAITVRIHSQKSKVATAYFYGDKETRFYSKGHTWTYVDEQLRVTLPTKASVHYNKEDRSYRFQGQLPNIFDMQDLCWALDYIKEQFDIMTGGKTA